MNLGIVGATGAVGQIVRQILEARKFPAESVTFIASARSAGQKIQYRGDEHVVQELTPTVFAENRIDLVIGSTPDDVARQFVPWAIEAGAVVVDESGAHRMLDHVPLVVPEVNPEAITGHSGLIASPNCSTTQMVVAMKPLNDFAKIRRVIVSTYQAASGAGQGGSAELNQGAMATLTGKQCTYETFSHPLAFNVIPHIGSAKHEHYTSEEMKMVNETRKIFDDDSISVCATCVRVPVAVGHSESIVIESESPISREKAIELFKAAPGITVLDDLDSGMYPMPINCDGEDDVFVGRIRKDISCENGLAFWCVSDNLRKGAATNAVQIAELLI